MKKAKWSVVKVLKTNLTLKTCPLGASFSSFGCFVFDLGIFVFEFLGALFSSLGCFVFEIWVLRASVFVFECLVFETLWVLSFRDFGASCFGLRFRVLRFRNYHHKVTLTWKDEKYRKRESSRYNTLFCLGRTYEVHSPLFITTVWILL